MTNQLDIFVRKQRKGDTMNAKYLFCFIALLMLSYNCSQTNKTTSSVNPSEINYEDLSLEKGKAIAESVCITCHDPIKPKMDRIAPPLELVKRNYVSITESEREFILLVTDFILSPTDEKAKLHEDVDIFGLMDPLGYSRTDVQSVAMYLYRTELEYPDWVEENKQ